MAAEALADSIVLVEWMINTFKHWGIVRDDHNLAVHGLPELDGESLSHSRSRSCSSLCALTDQAVVCSKSLVSFV